MATASTVLHTLLDWCADHGGTISLTEQHQTVYVACTTLAAAEWSRQSLAYLLNVDIPPLHDNLCDGHKRADYPPLALTNIGIGEVWLTITAREWVPAVAS